METKTCSRCHETKALTSFVTCRRDPSGYAAHCRDCQRQATQRWSERRRLGLVNRRMERELAHSGARRWGVEIECNGATEDAILNALRRHGIEVRNEGYNHTTRSYWKLTTDSSVSSTGTGRNYGGWELVSPPLSGSEGFQQLQTVCTALAEAGATVDKSCGLHIHHEARELTVQTARNLIRNYTTARQTINRLVAPSRRMNSTYCAGYDEHAMRWVESGQTINDIGSAVGRYHDVNLCAWGRQGTVEFRQHQGTVEYAKMAAWITLTQAMLEQSLNLGLVGWARTTVNDLVNALGRTDDASYWTRREARLNGYATVAA